ncbi:MAG: hypothetical protein OEM91_16300, partial [Hyphomicrobiales bacterium]|nr:hypothetical protein [Hyphomicrobiales bacterium]
GDTEATAALDQAARLILTRMVVSASLICRATDVSRREYRLHAVSVTKSKQAGFMLKQMLQEL